MRYLRRRIGGFRLMPVPGLLLSITVALAACHGGTMVDPDPVSKPAENGPNSSAGESSAVLELRFDQTTTYQDLELRWLHVHDSRCPIGVNCVWEGEVTATLEVDRGEEDSVQVELTLHVGSEPERATAFGYELELQSVDPHPKRGITPERSDYVAKVEVDES
jgi:hypothetical protein